MADKTVVDEIVNDSKLYSILYLRWTVTYWVFTLMASGTAVTAAISNVYHSQKPGVAAGSLSGFDIFLMVMAGITVVATVLMAAMRPDQQAERYRLGDLMMQDAIMDYKGSDKTDADVQELKKVWHQAQKVLRGGVGLFQASPEEPQDKTTSVVSAATKTP